VTHGSEYEIELAFSVTAEAASRLSSEVLTAATETELAAVYYDTPDLALRSAGYALRVRREGERWMQTLKAGAPGDLARREFERPITKGVLDPRLLKEAALPAALLARVPELRPAFKTDIRRRHQLVKAESAEIEVALDIGEIIAGDCHLAVREVELELKTGEADALFDLARRLSESGGLRLSFANKSDRGFALAGGDLAVMRSSGAPPSQKTDVAAALRRFGGEALHQLGGSLDLLQGCCSRPALQQAIEGVERLSILMTVPGGGQGAAPAGLLSDLAWLRHRLAELYELDSFMSHAFLPLASWAQDRVAAAAFGRALLAARHATARELASAAKSVRASRLLLNAAEVAAAVAPLQVGAPSDNTPAWSEALLAAEATAFEAAASRFVEGEPAGVEHLLQTAKNLVYLGGALGPALPARLRLSAMRRRKLERLIRPLDDLRAVQVARQVADHALSYLPAPDWPLAERANFAAGVIIIARMGRSRRTTTYTKRTLQVLLRRSDSARRASFTDQEME